MLLPESRLRQILLNDVARLTLVNVWWCALGRRHVDITVEQAGRRGIRVCIVSVVSMVLLVKELF